MGSTENAIEEEQVIRRQILSRKKSKNFRSTKKFKNMTAEARKDWGLRKGFFQKPRCLLWMRKHGIISKTQYLLIDILLHLENRFAIGNTPQQKQGKEFFCSMKDILSYGVLSENSIQQARAGLIEHGFMTYKEGNTGKASTYTVIDFQKFTDELEGY